MQGNRYSDRAAFEERIANQDKISEDIRDAIDIYEQIILDEEAKIAALKGSSLSRTYPSSTLSNFDPKLVLDSSLSRMDMDRDSYSSRSNNYDADRRYSQDDRLASEIVERRKKEYQSYDSSDELFRRINSLKSSSYSNYPTRSYPERTSFTKQSKPRSFFERLLPSFKDSSSDSFNDMDYQRRDAGRNLGTRKNNRMPYSVIDSSPDTLNIDPQQILAKKSAEEIRVKEGKIDALKHKLFSFQSDCF